MKSRTICMQIERPPGRVYEFVADPRNLPQWVRSFCTAVRQVGDDWFMETPGGPVGDRFAPVNEFGVLDHVVRPPHEGAVLVPMRVVPNGETSEVLFTLFQQPQAIDEEFDRDSAMVAADLETLKRVLEASD